MAEKARCFEILKQPYLCNHLTNFYRTKTKLYVKASSIIVYGKENEGNNLKLCLLPVAVSCQFPGLLHQSETHQTFSQLAAIHRDGVVGVSSSVHVRYKVHCASVGLHAHLAYVEKHGRAWVRG